MCSADLALAILTADDSEVEGQLLNVSLIVLQGQQVPGERKENTSNQGTVVVS